MSKAFPPLAALVRALPRLQHTPNRPHIRTFHSPFVSLNAANPLTSSSAPSAATGMYEKQADSSPEPQVSSSGTRTYVVSEPDPSNTPYEVPSGAYPTSTSYENFTTTTAPNPEELRSSTSSSPPPHTTRAVPQNEAGAGRNTKGLGERGH